MIEPNLKDTSMNYILDSQIAVAKRIDNHHWCTVELTEFKLNDLMAHYRGVEIGVHDVFNDKYTLHLDDYRTEVMHFDGTITEWLESHPGRQLSLSKGLPELKLTQVRYTPGFERESNIVAVAGRNSHPGADNNPSISEDLCIGYKSLDSGTLAQYSLWSVDGFYCRSVDGGDFVRILEGGSIIYKGHNTSFGYLDFHKVGTVKTVPITKELVFPYVDEFKDYHKIQIKVPNKLLNTHTPMLVIGGYLHFLDDLFQVSGDDHLTCWLSKVSLVERVLQSKDSLDMTFMGLDNIEDTVEISSVISPEKLLAYVTCKHSFIVLVENKDLFVTKKIIDNNAPYGTALSEMSVGNGIMREHLGKAIDYWYVSANGMKSYSFDDKVRPNYLDYKQEFTYSINGALVNSKPVYKLQPYMFYVNARI